MTPLQAVSGMNDVLPDAGEVARWQRLEHTFTSLCGRYGFREVRTPLCEYTELFQRGVGETTDIVEKEMYTFDDRGGRRLSLRPEGTASAVRAALEHSVLDRQPVVRWCYAGPMFRAERPAKGRFRQFHQVGAEVYGDGSPAADAELIDLLTAFLRALGLSRFTVRVNSLGNAESRARFREALVQHYTPHLAALSPESQARLSRNPLRILDSKDPRDVALRAGAPSVLDALTPDDAEHFKAVTRYLDALKVPYAVDTTLVRGLDYYTRTVFEVVDTSGSLGAQDALGAGGRYDNLFSELGASAAVPAVGFALGIERLLLAAPEATAKTPFRVAVVAAAKATDEPVIAAVLGLARDLRAAGVEAHVDTRFVSMKSQMRQANEHGVQYTLVLGGNELARHEVAAKQMSDGAQSLIPRDQCVARMVEARAAHDGGAPTR